MKNLILRKLFLSAVVGGLSSTAFATLRITEMCPRPDAMDPNGKEAGWIELQNTGDTAITLSDYALIRFNRGKKEKCALKDDLKPFPEALGDLAPGARIVVYAGEEYDNVDKEEFKCYPVEGSTTGEQIGVFPFKVNPKNYPTVRLYKLDHTLAEDSTKHTLLQTLNIPVDLEDNKSFGPGSHLVTKPLIGSETAYTYIVTNGEEIVEGVGRGILAVEESVAATYVQGNAIESLVAMEGADEVTTAVEETDGIYNFANVQSAQDGLRATLLEGTVLDGGFAASFWFKTAQTSKNSAGNDGTGMVLFECRPSPSDDGTNNRAGVNLFIDGDSLLRIQPRNRSNGSKSIPSDGTVVTDNEWHHVVLTGGMTPGETITLYYDGEVAISAKLEHDITLQLAYLCYGRAYNSNSWLPYIGELKNIQFFPRVLTAAEVQAESALLSDVTSLTATDVTASETAEGEYTFGKSESSALAYLEDGNITKFDGETVAFWVKPTSFEGNGKEATVLVDCRNGSKDTTGYLLLRKDNGTIYVQRWNGSEVVNIEYFADDLPLNKWTHIAFSLNPKTTVGTLYINGVKVEGKTIDDYSDTTTKRRFGGSHDKYWRGLIGSMADVRVFNTILSDLDIARLHNANDRKQALVTVDGTSSTADTVVNVDSIAEDATVSGTYTGTLAQAGIVTVTSEKEGLTIMWNGVEKMINTAFEAGAGDYTLRWNAPALNGDISLTALQVFANTERYIFPTMTKGAENNYADAIPVGPQVGPQVGKKVDGTRALMGATPTAPVPAATDLPVTFTIYPLSDNGEVADENAITGVELLYVMDFGEMKTLTMTAGADNTWTTTIPGEELPEPGHLIRYAARITDGAGYTWRSPSENNLDDCPLWYGTIVQPTTDQNSATLQTFHLFADEFALNNMDKQFDTIEGSYPYGARVGIYDMQTEEYYDRVRIDLRGNTSASFNKKSHGLRFNKCHPLVFDHPFDGFEIETRKTSFTAEWPDPTFLRQSLSFYIWRNAGNLVPFHYPVRLLRNGEFYQLAFHTNRFTDELIEDYYGLDPMGYGYKNVGTFAPNLSTSAGGIEKKTPDDGIETGTVAMAPLQEFVNRFTSVKSITESEYTELPDVTKVVVQHFDLPAWFNYLATARITQEADDVWANISAYYDINGTNTWMPLAYDHNLSFGQWYYGDDRDMGRIGLRPADDTFKSHPFYGGHRIRAYKKSGATVGNPNYAVEAVWQSEKFRRLYLRRLRTLMDEVLKEPGTEQKDTPFWEYMTTMQAAMTEDAATDRAKWGYGDSTVIYVWDKTMSLEEGLVDMWDNYVVPRRVHLFETHSVTNADKEIGYGSKLNAGIPAPQSAIADLKAGMTLKTKIAELDDVLVIQNTNDEAIDMSKWTLAGAVEWTLPPGTVIDAQIDGVPGELYIVADRNAYVLAHETELTDQVIVGNAEFTESQVFTLTATDGTQVIATEPSDAMLGLRVAEVMPATPEDGGDGAEYIVLKNILTDKTINLEGVNVRAMKDEDGEPWKVDITLPAGTLEPGATCRLDKADFEESGWDKITNGKVRFEIRDAEGALCQYAYWSDKWYPQMDEGGASLIAVSFESEIGTGDDGKLDWKPSFVWPADDEAAQAAITEAIAANGAIATWLRTLDETGNEALASFTGSADDLELCWLINLSPVASPDVEMAITAITFDAGGDLQIKGTLSVNDNAHETDVNGLIKLFKYTTLEGTPTEETLSIKTFPLGFSTTPGEARFFKVKIE
ncbi:MAG: LamG-like jellyroll fold domain-containing protein [bacterium]|nr:LamG-like jellyroll fold domain-containing protein [bacterium]